MSAQPNLLHFRAPSAPESLTEKYKPTTIQGYAGIATAKETMLQFTARPYRSAWTFVGDSGTGKTTMAYLVAELIDAQVTHVPSQECSVDRLRQIVQMCHYRPMSGQPFSLVLIDEADSMSKAARDFLLSALDKLPPDTVIIFTCNSVETFEDRFLSRTRVLDFTNYRIQREAVEFLENIWRQEAPGKEPPKIAAKVKDLKGNMRAALMWLELELMLA